MNTFYTKREELVEDIMGIRVSDPYRWLEDEDSTEVKEWTDAQNEYAEENLRGDTFSIFHRELMANLPETFFLIPTIHNGRYFYRERKACEQQYTLFVKDGIDGEPILLLDPNMLGQDSMVTIANWEDSESGRYITYELSEKGTEIGTVYVKDVDTGEVLPERLERCSHSSIAWLPDDSGFFYMRHPYADDVPANEKRLHQKVYFHVLGTRQKDDVIIFGEGRPKDDMIYGLKVSPDGKHLVIHVAQIWSKNNIYAYDILKKTITTLVDGVSAKFSLYFSDTKVFLLTNYKADRYRVLSAPIETWAGTSLDEWVEIIAEDRHTLDSIAISKSKLLAHYLVNACSEVRVYNHEGKEKELLPLPPFSNMRSVQARFDEEEFFYVVVSFTAPFVVYRYNPVPRKYEVYRVAKNPLLPEDYEVSQEWCISNDGTRVPFFMVYKKGLVRDSKNPLVLWGYGAHGTSVRPSFREDFIPWIERGGIFAVANIRGGGEFGKLWQEAGSGLDKQNSFDDFIAVAEHLIAQKYTDTQHLGICGGSMGGVLVSAVSVQRPGLFKAVCAEVGITDIVRFPLFGIAVRWTGELGDPRDEKGLRVILKWSPYHNVKEGTEYPAYLFITGENDARVNPLHSRKMAAMLQWANKSNQVFLFTEKDAGHGGGKPTAKIVEGSARILSFFAKELGLKV